MGERGIGDREARIIYRNIRCIIACKNLRFCQHRDTADRSILTSFHLYFHADRANNCIRGKIALPSLSRLATAYFLLTFRLTFPVPFPSFYSFSLYSFSFFYRTMTLLSFFNCSPFINNCAFPAPPSTTINKSKCNKSKYYSLLRS